MQKILPAKRRQQLGRDLIPFAPQKSERKVFCHDFESPWIKLQAASIRKWLPSRAREETTSVHVSPIMADWQAVNHSAHSSSTSCLNRK